MKEGAFEDGVCSCMHEEKDRKKTSFSRACCGETLDCFKSPQRQRQLQLACSRQTTRPAVSAQLQQIKGDVTLQASGS